MQPDNKPALNRGLEAAVGENAAAVHHLHPR